MPALSSTLVVPYVSSKLPMLRIGKYHSILPIPFHRLYYFREENRRDEIKKLTSNGVIPHYAELEKRPEISASSRPWLMGRVSAMINVSYSTRISGYEGCS